jgi:hypothetical protein
MQGTALHPALIGTWQLQKINGRGEFLPMRCLLYHPQVRLKLLPLLLEWDMRQGPRPGPSSGVQFRPTGIRKVSSKGAEDAPGVPARQQQGWRYVLLVERLQQQQGPDAGAAAAADDDDDAEDLAVDLAWIAGTARSRPPKFLASSAAAVGSAAGDGGVADSDELCLSQMPASQGPSFSCSQAAPASQAAGSGGGRSGGSLQFSEHRSVRCSLVEAVWPELVAAYRCGQCVEFLFTDYNLMPLPSCRPA